MSKISKSPVNLLNKLIIEKEKGKKQNHRRDLKRKCNDPNIKKRYFRSKLCQKKFPKLSHRLDELAQPKKLNLLSVFAQNLEDISIFQIENLLNILYHRDHQTPGQAMCTILQNLNQHNKLTKRKKDEIEILKHLIVREQMKNESTQIDCLINESKEFFMRGKKFQLNSTSFYQQINQKLCHFFDHFGHFKLMNPVLEPVPDCQNKNMEGLFHVQEYFPSIQPIGPNHIGKTLLWQTVNSKYDCQQDFVNCDFNKFDNIFEEQKISSASFDIESNLVSEITEKTNSVSEITGEKEIDSSMFEINKEDCEQSTQKGAAFQMEKARVKAIRNEKRVLKKKPDVWKCLLDTCKTPKWEVNWIDKDKKK